jgi:hypothetical protein
VELASHKPRVVRNFYHFHQRAISKSREIYGKEVITERHRHRYEVNNNLIDKIENAGLKISGRSIDGSLVEMVPLWRQHTESGKLSSVKVLSACLNLSFSNLSYAC